MYAKQAKHKQGIQCVKLSQCRWHSSWQMPQTYTTIVRIRGSGTLAMALPFDIHSQLKEEESCKQMDATCR